VPKRVSRLPQICALAAATALALTACGSGDEPERAFPSTAGKPTPASTTAAPPAAVAGDVNPLVRQVLPSLAQVSAGAGVGSGLVLDTEGHVITTAHLIGETKKVLVSVGLEGVTGALPATVIGAYAPDDLAVVKIDSPPNGLQPARFGDSTKLLVGNPVTAIGFPFGIPSSVTTGVVSGIGRTITESVASGAATVPGLIQTSAAINPGNGGGALLDSGGAIIGMPVLMATGDPPGIGYAINASMLRDIGAQIIKDGRVTTPHRSKLGAGISSATSHGKPAGAKIATLEPGGPAVMAGLREGEVVVGVGALPINAAQDLATALANAEPDQVVMVTVADDADVKRTVEVKLAPLL